MPSIRSGRLVHGFSAYMAASFIAVVALLTVVAVDTARAEPLPNGVPGNWALILNEEFSANGLNTALWTPEWPSGPMSGQCTSPSLVSQPGNGYLYLQVRAQNSTCGGTNHPDTGSLVESNPADGKPGHSGFLYSYGYVEWHVYIVGWGGEAQGCPKGGCIPDWPALWSFPEIQENEIDTMEGLHGKACHTWHHHVSPIEETQGCQSGSYAGWHTYGVDWEPGVLKFYYDGAQVGEVKTAYINSTPQYLIMDDVPPGSYGGQLVVPNEITVDYVRVWQHPVPPTVTTSAASGVLEEQAVLNGTVNPNGVDAKYHFEYGETTAYGLATSQGDAGSGRSSVPESATITGLVPNTTYHYRIVASNTGGTSYGTDQTLKTSFIRTTPVAIREASTGYQWVYYVGREHAVWEWTWNGSSWLNSRPGGFLAANTNPTAVRDSASGNQWAYYVGGSDMSIWESNWNGSSWTQSRLGGETSPNTSPVVLREPGPGHQWLYYVGKDHAIWEWTWNGASWSNNSVGGFVAPSTTPAVARDEASGHQWVFYVGGGDTSIWQAEWNGSSWVQTHVGGEVAPNTNPVVLREAGTGYLWVYYVNKSDKSIWEWTWNGSSWSHSSVGGLVAPNTTPSVAREAGTGYQWVYYIGGGDGAIWEWTWNGSTWVSSRPGGLAASETSPAVIQPWAGFQWVYYQGSEDPITQLFWNGGTWNNLGL